jgi:hypothetical protein
LGFGIWDLPRSHLSKLLDDAAHDRLEEGNRERAHDRRRVNPAGFAVIVDGKNQNERQDEDVAETGLNANSPFSASNPNGPITIGQPKSSSARATAALMIAIDASSIRRL